MCERRRSAMLSTELCCDVENLTLLGDASSSSHRRGYNTAAAARQEETNTATEKLNISVKNYLKTLHKPVFKIVLY